MVGVGAPGKAFPWKKLCPHNKIITEWVAPFTEQTNPNDTRRGNPFPLNTYEHIKSSSNSAHPCGPFHGNTPLRRTDELEKGGGGDDWGRHGELAPQAQSSTGWMSIMTGLWMNLNTIHGLVKEFCLVKCPKNTLCLYLSCRYKLVAWIDQPAHVRNFLLFGKMSDL
jgi:hypothetical protein